MLSATLEAGLSGYAIGGKVRALRLKKKMGLVELGQHSGLSPALLSKSKGGGFFPTLPTLLRIALVFSVGLDYFFAGAREKPLPSSSRGARQRPPAHAGVEFIYTLKGRLNVHIDGQEHALESGDSMYFDSGLPHGYRRSGASTCCAIVVTTA